MSAISVVYERLTDDSLPKESISIEYFKFVRRVFVHEYVVTPQFCGWYMLVST